MTAPTIRDLAITYGSLGAPHVLTGDECERFAEFIASRWREGDEPTGAQWIDEYWAWKAHEIAGDSPAIAGPAQGRTTRSNSPGGAPRHDKAAGGF